MMSNQRYRFNWGFWIRWVFASTLGWSLSILVVYIGFVIWLLTRFFAHCLDNIGECYYAFTQEIPSQGALSNDIWSLSLMGWVLAGVIIGGIIGSTVGIIQGLILRRQISSQGKWANARAWVLATATGWVLTGMIIGVTATLNKGGSLEFVETASINWFVLSAVIGAVGGAAAGLVQSQVFKLQVRRSNWILASVLGWGAGFIGGGILVRISRGLLLPGVVAGAYIGLWGGGITGIPLAIQLRSLNSENQQIDNHDEV